MRISAREDWVRGITSNANRRLPGRVAVTLIASHMAVYLPACAIRDLPPAGGEVDAKELGCGKARAMVAGLEACKRSPNGLPAHDVTGDTDVIHYDLDIAISDIDPPSNSCTITGTNVMHIRSKSANLTEFVFRLWDEYTITGAYLNGITAVAPVIESETTRKVILDRTYGVDEEFTLTIAYTGTSLSLGFGSLRVATHSGAVPVVSSLSCPYYSYTWWPSKDGDLDTPGSNADKATMDFSITVPEDFVVPSNGLLQSVDALPDGLARYNWTTDYPIAPYLASFAATEYNTWTADYSHPNGTMPVEFYIYPVNDTQSHRTAWEKVVDMIGTFANVYGEYPFINEKYGIYNFPFGGGMEHQTITGQGTFAESITAHELAHQWWGDMITCATWSDVWLNEGFATYSECIWEEFESGASSPADYFDCMRDRKPYYAGADSTVYVYSDQIASGGFARVFSRRYSYAKGAWVLHQLRGVVGDDAFFEILANYRATYAYGAATTDDFVAVASATYGQDLTWFFDQWVYNAGAPTYEYGWDTTSRYGQDFLRVQIRQVKSDPDPEVFTMPVDLVATTASGTQTFTVFNDRRVQGYVIPISEPVTSLRFDPNGWILRKSVENVPYEVNQPTIAVVDCAGGENHAFSIDPNNSVTHVALQIRLVSMKRCSDDLEQVCRIDEDCSAGFHSEGSCIEHPSVGEVGWVSEPFDPTCQNGPGEAPHGTCRRVDRVAGIVDAPVYRRWHESTLHLNNNQILPKAVYEIRATADETIYTDPLVVATFAPPQNRQGGSAPGGVLPLTRTASRHVRVLSLDDTILASLKQTADLLNAHGIIQ
ncbi:MAG: M1 family metallopeptidase [Phycisphaerales bacterium]|nr:MAG: M1 family metallopeptidase [Phycisphaerales bacterium]